MRFKNNTYIFLVISISMMMLLFSGCSSNKKPKISPDKKSKYVFFPALPAKPRFQYLTTFSRSSDVEKKKSKLFNFIAGDESKKDYVIKKAYGVDAFRGIIYVCDTANSVVVKLDLQKRALGYFARDSRIAPAKPVNLVIDKERGIIYIADMKRKQVLAYDINGNLIRTYGGNKGNISPADVEINGDKLFVCDAKGHQIVVIDLNSGEIINKIGEKGNKEGQLLHPSSIKIYKNKLYVSDTTNFRVSIFDINGNYIDKVGKVGKSPGSFARPKGIEVDKDGRIYVIDASFQNVQVFDKKHELLLYFLGPGNNKFNLYLPYSINIDYENVKYFAKYISPEFRAEYIIYITSNFGRNKVNVYAYGEYDPK
ncbi:MAG: 6-bladed beta-propeller [Candidatus Aminicenantes bacterium]|nr:6-bladed beta-propeller [Candidatus Aminicenantes bacterium]MCK5003492.1 6-bladed beta-propeller [Candidatus Aminicenantes bacterium]